MNARKLFTLYVMLKIFSNSIVSSSQKMHVDKIAKVSSKFQKWISTLEI